MLWGAGVSSGAIVMLHGYFVRGKVGDIPSHRAGKKVISAGCFRRRDCTSAHILQTR